MTPAPAPQRRWDESATVIVRVLLFVVLQLWSRRRARRRRQLRRLQQDAT